MDATYRYSDIADVPSSFATRLIDTAPIPSAAATATPAATTRSRLSARRGPLVGRSRTPQASSKLAGSPVGSPITLTSPQGKTLIHCLWPTH